MAQPPTGTVTFLFTDIEGSTRLLQRLEDEYSSILTEHQRLLRAAWTAHNGYEVDTQGDAFFVAFPSAPQAVAAAAEATQALAIYPWPDGMTLRVRMGLHTGTPHLVGENYVGLDVHRAARIASAGHGGQILLSQTTVDLARDSLPAGATLRDLGEHRLKDLLRPEPMYQLVLPGLPDAFPPLKTLDRLPNNLPIEPTPLLGRERELADLRDLVLQPAVRLVSLLGPGGAGKTSLALQLAADLAEHFPDGVYFIALAPVSDAAFVLPTLTQTLGVREVAGESLAETLRAFVREKRLLLILGNLEQILAPTATLVTDLLRAGSQLKLLATSRSPLRVRGEREYAVPPLGMPNPRHLPPLEELATYPSIHLFTQRALAVKRDFALTRANAPAVAQVCVLLDGLPLALELAAARSRLLPPPALLQRLAPAQSSGGQATRLRLLTGGARDLPARQRTLTDTIAWSYDLLDEDERALYRRLAVFVDGWTLEAAEAVVPTGGGLVLDVLDGLESLAEKSLIRQDEDNDEGETGEARFAMLQVIREFGLLRLEEAGESAAVREAHARYFLNIAEEADQYWRRAEEGAWLDRLEREHENLLAALRLARDSQAVALGLRLAGMLGYFWWNRGYYTEGRAWLETFLSLAPVESDQAEDGVEKVVHARALRLLGRILTDQGDATARLHTGEEGLALARASGNLGEVCEALHQAGVAIVRDGDLARAEALWSEGLVLARDHRQLLIPTFLNNLGEVLRRRHDLDSAAAYYAECEQVAEQQGDAGGLAVVRQNLGLIALERGDAVEAARLVRVYLQSSWFRGDRYGVASALESLGAALVALGDHASAGRLLGMSAALWDEIGAVREEQDIYDKAVAQLRASMGSAAFEAAFVAGRAADRAVEIPKRFEGEDPGE